MTDATIFELLNSLDKEYHASIDVHQFVKLVEMQRTAAAVEPDDNIAGAFVALGGVPTDKKSFIMAAKLKTMIKDEFKLTFDIDDLLAQVGVTDSESAYFCLFFFFACSCFSILFRLQRANSTSKSLAR